MMKNTTVVLVLLALLGVALAACPHDCTGHGECRHDVCHCEDGWSGDDCSEEDTPLDSGVQLSGSLNTFRWHYYHIRVAAGTTALNISVHETSRYGDVDVFVNREDFPTQTNYLYKDTTTAKEILISIPNPPAGMWYIGLYGYWHVDYTIQADVIADCAVQCGEHGHCQGRSCQCDDDWTGETCSVFDKAIMSNAVETDAVETSGWKFYHLTVLENHILNVKVTQLDETGEDVDVYLKEGDRPGFFNFDYINTTTDAVSTVNVAAPTPGLWYIGLYGYRGGRYTLEVESMEEIGCPTQCSQHGSCTHNACECSEGFSGDDCENMIQALQLDSPVHGFASANQFNYYYFQINTENNVVITTDQDDREGDCDVFVREAERPTRINYDYANLGYEKQFNVTVENPSDKVWRIGVYGWRPCAYSISISIPSVCSCKGPHGHCEPHSDVCVCEENWTGVGCDIGAKSMESEEVFRNEAVRRGQWNYYSMTTTSSAALISMKEKETTGHIWLYVSLSGFPQLDAFEASDHQTNTDFHEVHMLYPRKELRTYFIGVYGNPFMRPNATIHYDVTGWSPNF